MGSQGKDVDLVVVFDASVPKGADKAKEVSAIRQQFSSLVATLKDAGLHVTSRSGPDSSQSILIFVKASEDRIQKEIHRERLADWLAGVSSMRGDPRTPRDFAKEPVTPAERVRLTYNVLTSAKGGIDSSVSSSATTGPTAGLVGVPDSKEYPRVKAIFPPTDPAFVKEWLDKWSSTKYLTGIPPSELIPIKDVYGEHVALYFAFLRFYFRSLVFPASFGFACWLLGLSFHPVYSISLVVWSVYLVESWRIRERNLVVEWGTHGCERVEVQRPTFRGDSRQTDPVTGNEVEVFPWHKTLTRQFASVPLLALFAALLVALVGFIYILDTLAREVYDGPGKSAVALVPTMLFVGLVPQLTGLWGKVALRMTHWENHAHSSEFDMHHTLKVFALNSLSAYGNLLLTSYIYIPFGSYLVPRIMSRLPIRMSKQTRISLSGDKHSVNEGRLHAQIVAYTLTQQISGAFMETLLPVVLEYVKGKLKDRKEATGKSENGEKKGDKALTDPEDEREFLRRIRREADLPEYSLFSDYAEMALQFGYITLFSAIWPISPLWSFINNFVELRSDAFKLTHHFRRPVPQRVGTIGPWLEVLSFITWLATLTNASLVYLYQPHTDHTGTLFASQSGMNVTETLANAGEGAFASSNIHLASLQNTAQDEHAFKALRSTMFAALLVALAAEHGYVVVRASMRFLLERMFWIGRKRDVAVRRGQHELRKAYLDMMEMREGPIKLAERSGELAKASEDTPGDDAFWNDERDQGLAEIDRVGKVE